MSETSKQEVLLSDLSVIQSQVEILANKCRDLTEVNLELETQLSELKKEKTNLDEKISKLEFDMKKKSKTDFLGTLNEKEREELKNNIGDLISRIDFHLSAVRQT